MNLSLLLIDCSDHDECNRNIFHFVHHFIDPNADYSVLELWVGMLYVMHMVLGVSFIWY